MKKKRVTFADSKNQVHIMRDWDFAYRDHRKKYWENFAMDRDRFQNRIKRTSKILNPIIRKQGFKIRKEQLSKILNPILEKHLEKIRDCKRQVALYETKMHMFKEFETLNIDNRRWEGVFTDSRRFVSCHGPQTATRRIAPTVL